MVLGNALTGVAPVLDTVSQAVVRERPAIEARLALGATRLEALDSLPTSSGLRGRQGRSARSSTRS
jgi:ABC-type iron transport system FetAB permease component